uniref:Uncharacterized protein n=1 Tax=Steinernema glaseri TaxID=37863 RepID=A0A1I7ZER5_9BILA
MCSKKFFAHTKWDRRLRVLRVCGETLCILDLDIDRDDPNPALTETSREQSVPNETLHGTSLLVAATVLPCCWNIAKSPSLLAQSERTRFDAMAQLKCLGYDICRQIVC